MYKLPTNAGYKKFLYDGSGLSIDINLGEIKYYNNDGSIETYTSNKIELHFPAEHWVTLHKQTPRAVVELQIHHTKVKVEGENRKETDESSFRANRAIISILYHIGNSLDGDMFFNRMGINRFNLKNNGELNIPQPNQELDKALPTPAAYPMGFNFLSFQGLLYALNTDSHVFFYYGSETSPPCREDVLWMVLGEPRSISEGQFQYLNALIPKPKNKADGNRISNPNQLYGNNRNIKLYDENLRGKILSSKNGILTITQTTFFSEEPLPDKPAE